jgi:hypothetical protein
VLRVFGGLLLGLVLAAAGGYVWFHESRSCLGRCGDGTRCDDNRCVVAGPAVAAAPSKDASRRHKRRGSGGLGPAAPELKLNPGDERMTASGDALGRAEHIDLTQAGDDGRELGQEDLDAVFNPAQAQISRCIGDAVGDYPLETGKVEVAFRVERSGAVKKIRVEAPQLLMRRGLYGCVRPIVSALHFPASGGANVVTYPFALQ